MEKIHFMTFFRVACFHRVNDLKAPNHKLLAQVMIARASL